MPTLALVLAAAATAAPLPPAAPLPDPVLAEAAAGRALATIAAGDPPIEEVQAAAGRVAEGTAPAAGFARRSRIAALLPRVTAEYRRADQSYRVVGLQGSGEVDYLRQAPGSAVVVRATWDLGSLVAAQGEIAAAAEAADRARRRADAVKRATSLYYERRRALLALLLEPPGSPRSRAEAELEVERLGAELDALTGGLLSGAVRP